MANETTAGSVKVPFTVHLIDGATLQAEPATEEGNLPAYIDWLKEQGAPQHILDYVTEQMEN